MTLILRQLGKALEDARNPNLRSSQGGQRPTRTMPHQSKDLSLPVCSCPGISPRRPPAPYLEDASAAADRRRCWSRRSGSASSAGAPPRPPLLHAAGSRAGLLGRGFWGAGRPTPPGNRGAPLSWSRPEVHVTATLVADWRVGERRKRLVTPGDWVPEERLPGNG